MSDYQNTHDDDDIPRFEPWLAVMATAFVPVVALLYLPSTYLIALIGIAAALFAAGLVMLLRQNSSRTGNRPGVQPPSADSGGQTPKRSTLEMEGAEP